ncbi:flagellar hook-associated protein FlgL [Neptunomonas sp. XY-337]|uniref:flagellar hook-associated protein FlgL n=1 Tax=Neptunomonas sp. XY-337 TaxID=2561897 RepID=UPI00145AE0B2|nr:flagellar hook-associated protein FlgL [Neptunomonas sp. XY-337]
MRISTQQQYLQTIDQMQRTQATLADKQNEINTGKRLLTPSDDPVAAAQVVKLERELAQYEKFDDNINVTKRRLQLEDSLLDDINIAMDRINELALKAGNEATLTDQDRKGIANELYELTDYVAGLMNTQDSEGEYIFAGSKGSTKPYEELANNRFAYRGDDGQRSIQVGGDLYIASNDSGQYLFEAVEGPLEINMTGVAIAEANATNTQPFIREASFSSTALEEQFLQATEGVGDITIRVDEPQPNVFEYSVLDAAGNPVADTDGTPLQNIPAGDLSTTPLAVNMFGLTFELHEPSNGVNGNEITLNIERERQNILDVAVDLAKVLEQPVDGPESKAELSEAVATALNGVQQAQDRNNEARTTLGSRLSTLEKIAESNIDFELFTKTAISRLVDTDMAEAITEFRFAEATLQASQATFGRVASLSLFNYIN